MISESCIVISVVGLGNPGKQYEKTPHNLGFYAVDAFQKQHRFSNWRFVKKYNALISEGKINGQKVLLAKPQTYMNKSGEAVKKIATGYRLPATNLFVVHDEADLPFGILRISQGRGSAGHKGVKSIMLALKSKDMVRFRMGSNTAKKQEGGRNLSAMVLKRFSPIQEKTARDLAKKTALAITDTLTQGVLHAMTEYNKAPRK